MRLTLLFQTACVGAPILTWIAPLLQLHFLVGKQIEDFQNLRANNRIIAEGDIEVAEFELLEFDRLSQQGTNDASSIKERVGIMLDYI